MSARLWDGARGALIGVSLAAAVALAPGAARAQATYPDTFKLGAILNLSGGSAQQGLEFRRGLELAAKHWNETERGIDGTPIEMVFEDSGAQPARAVTAAQKLINVDKVIAMANVYTSPVLAVVPIAEKARVLQISAGATSPRLINVSKYFMTNLANAGLEVEVVLALAKKKLGIGKIAVLYGNDDFGTAMREAVDRNWAALGGTITGEEGTDPAKTDLVSIATKLAAGKPEAVYLALAGGNIGAAVKQLREAGITAPILSHQGLEGPELFSVAGSAAENSYWTSAAAAATNERDVAFGEAYKKAYEKDPTVFAKTHFDLAMSFFEAVRRVKKEKKEWSAENIRASMLALGPVTGVLGTFTYRDDGTALRALDIRTVKDGKAVVFLPAAQVQSEGIFSFGGAAAK